MPGVNPQVFLQFLTSFQSPDGQMKLRVTTVARKWVDTSVGSEEKVYSGSRNSERQSTRSKKTRHQEQHVILQHNIEERLDRWRVIQLKLQKEKQHMQKNSILLVAAVAIHHNHFFLKLFTVLRRALYAVNDNHDVHLLFYDVL